METTENMFERVKNRIVTKTGESSQTVLPAFKSPSSNEMWASQRRTYLQLINELKVLAQTNSAYDNQREEIASKVGELINVSYALLAQREQQLERTREEIGKLYEENSRLRKAIGKIVTEEPDLDLSALKD